MATQTATMRSWQDANLVPSRRAQPSAPTMTVKPPMARPYKDFLTPALHRRFTRAALLVLILCLAEAIMFGCGSGWLWRWFPLGPAGLGALMLFMPCLAVFIVRVMNMHVGKRTTTSTFETFVQLVASPSTWTTAMWYMWSAWFFGEIYIWSRTERANLGWVDVGRAYERPRLNENPIALRCIYVLIAVGHTVSHLIRDFDRVPIEEEGHRAKPDQQRNATDTLLPASVAARIPQSLKKLSEQWVGIVNRTLQVAICGVVFSLPVYFLLIRHTAWTVTYPIGRTFFRQLPSTAPPTGLIHVSAFLFQAFSSTIMLVLLWEVSSAVFTIFTAQPPLKKGEPLTSEVKDAHGTAISKSADPNGSLLRGLNSKNEIPKSFAYWELYLICTSPDFSGRRKTIFAEVDRKYADKSGVVETKSTWKQVSECCIRQLTDISERIKLSQQPADYQQQATDNELQRRQQANLTAQQRQETLGLPNIADRKVENNRAVLQSRKPDFVHNLGNMAKSFGQTPGAQNPFTPRAKRAIEWGADKALSRETQERWSKSALKAEAHSSLITFLKSPLGEQFRQTFARRVRAVVFGIPHSNMVNIAHAAKSLARLAAVSLKEDDYGQVAKDVPHLIRTLILTINVIENFGAGLAPSWTDVYFDARTDREIDEIKELLDVLKMSLEEVILAFGEYASNLGLSQKEMREAKDAAGRGRQEMVQQTGNR